MQADCDDAQLCLLKGRKPKQNEFWGQSLQVGANDQNMERLIEVPHGAQR